MDLSLAYSFPLSPTGELLTINKCPLCHTLFTIFSFIKDNIHYQEVFTYCTNNHEIKNMRYQKFKS